MDPRLVQSRWDKLRCQHFWSWGTACRPSKNWQFNLKNPKRSAFPSSCHWRGLNKTACVPCRSRGGERDGAVAGVNKLHSSPCSRHLNWISSARYCYVNSRRWRSPVGPKPKGGITPAFSGEEQRNVYAKIRFITVLSTILRPAAPVTSRPPLWIICLIRSFIYCGFAFCVGRVYCSNWPEKLKQMVLLGAVERLQLPNSRALTHFRRTFRRTTLSLTTHINRGPLRGRLPVRTIGHRHNT